MIFSCTSLPTSTTLLTPKMDNVRSIASSAGVIKFTVSLNSLDTQYRFDHIFGSHPTCHIGHRVSRIESSWSLRPLSLPSIVWFCSTHICWYRWLRFATHAIGYYSCFVTAQNKISNSETVLTPDDLSSRYIDFFPLLSLSAMTLSFFLVNLFFFTLYLSSCTKSCTRGLYFTSYFYFNNRFCTGTSITYPVWSRCRRVQDTK